MSKDVLIRRNGEQPTFNSAKRLNTPIAGGSNVSWLPEDETIPTTIEITQNGTYAAADFGYYGFDKVDVLVAGGESADIETDNSDGTVTLEHKEAPISTEPNSSIVVRDPKTGMVTYYRVLDNGDLEKKNVPSYAMVTTAPKTEYEHGEAVSYAGMSITLYYGDDTVATDWNGGEISYGTSAWNSYTKSAQGSIDTVAENGLVIVYIIPWWYADGLKFDEGYQLRAYYEVTIG